MNHKLWSDYPELLDKCFQVKVMQYIEGENDEELEFNKYCCGVFSIASLITDFDLDKVGITAKMSIKNSVVKIDLKMHSGRSRNPDYGKAWDTFYIEFANLGDWLAAADIFEEIGIGERFIIE